MSLTEKDKEFLERLKCLIDSMDLSVELKRDSPSYMILRGNYGEKIHKTFHMTRQGVRWRFGHIFNQAYVSAFETIMMIEQTFGARLRENAIKISKQRYTLHQQAMSNRLDCQLPGYGDSP